MPTTITLHLIIFCFGGLSLTAIYHTILYAHRKDRVLFSYCIYLWSITCYILYRLIFTGATDPYTYYYSAYFNITLAIDSNLMWASFICYAFFMLKVLVPTPEEQFRLVRIFKIIIYAIAVNIVWENVAANINTGNIELVLSISFRITLCLITFYVLILALRKKTLFYYCIAAGNIAIIFFSLISVYVQYAHHKIFFNINSWGWMMFGYFLDVVFFSAAIGYRLKEESAERLVALQKVIDQQAEINRFEMEKMKAVYETREEERNRISAELHDDLGGGLSTIKLMSEMVSRSHLNGNTHHLEYISQKSQELIENINEIIWSLNNKADSLGGMIAYLRQYAFNYFEHTTIQLSFHVPEKIEDITINPTIRRQVFLLSKECLHNILKHSQASQVIIVIALSNALKLSISDNGIGFTSNAPKGKGLPNMKMRIEKLKGTMAIKSDNGTTLSFNIPLDAAYNQSAISGSHFNI